MISHTVAVICAIILLILILYTQGTKLMARWRHAERCTACGRAVTERPFRMKIDDREVVFCCRHCADAYFKSRPPQETEEQDQG